MKPPPLPIPFSAEDQAALAIARALLAQPGLAIRLANTLGAPLEKGMNAAPKGWMAQVHTIAEKALRKSLEMAVKSLGKKAKAQSSDRWHKLLAAGSGGLAGAFGLPALAVELPLTTTIMLRSIADIAQSEGHSLEDVAVRLDCLAVFGMAGAADRSTNVESSFWATRAALASLVTETVTAMTGSKTLRMGSPVFAKLLSAIASRFGISVSEQFAAKAIPVIGMASGAMVNVVFLNHFQNVARAHFILLRLEQKYGQDRVRRAFDELA